MSPVNAQSHAEDNLRYDFRSALAENGLRVNALPVETLWLNITRLCNQACSHCHVGASPVRTEHMDRRTMNRCLEVLAEHDSCMNLDITGGAPELNPDFGFLVVEARKLDKRVVVRHNLSVIFDGSPQSGESKAYLPEFFAEHQVEIIASLPHYERCAADTVRGPGAFEKSIKGLTLLNAQGYGRDGTGLILNLMYNHDGPLLPADRAGLEATFKRELLSGHGVVFSELFTVTNVPIGRFRSRLQQSGLLDDYMNRLVNAFSPAAAQTLVCRSLISVGYDGRVYDCDFNQMLGMQVVDMEPVTIFNLDLAALAHREILFGSHCFGCTAGGGSN